HVVLVQLCRKGLLQRQKQVASFVYLSTDFYKAAAQAEALQKQHIPPLSAELSVLVLAAFIQRPDADFKQLAKMVFQKTGTRISREQVQILFETHGLKKKT
ncbi:MAG: hypothetical protein R6U68_09060, partial [Desulfobacteraceae bacterium]